MNGWLFPAAAAAPLRRLPMVLEAGERLLVARHDVRELRMAPDADAPAARDLAPGEVRLAVEAVALAADDVARIAQGRPPVLASEDPAWACPALWGYATVAESRAAGVAEGRRVFGLLPLGTHRVVAGDAFVAHGLREHFGFCTGADAIADGLQALLAPPYACAAAIDTFLGTHGFFGASQVLVSGACTRAGLAAAFCIAQRESRPALLGLCSHAELPQARASGCYDAVLPYAEAARLDPALATLHVNASGDPTPGRLLRARFGCALVRECEPQAATPAWRLPAGERWERFAAHLADGALPWLRMRDVHGAPAAAETWGAFAAGHLGARDGVMLSL